MSTTPNPSFMVKFAPAITTALTPETRTDATHDGVVKAKHLAEGQTVRAWLHDAPRGTERTVETVVRNEDGSMVTVTFVNPELTPDERVRTYKAAYRFYDESLVGKPVHVRPEHLTHRPFETLEGSI